MLTVDLGGFWMALGRSDTALVFLPGFFTFGLCPGEVMVVAKGTSSLLAISWMHVVMWVKGSGLPKKKKSKCIFSRHSGSCASDAEQMEQIAPSFPRKMRGEVGESRNFFLALGDVLFLGRLEPALARN